MNGKTRARIAAACIAALTLLAPASVASQMMNGKQVREYFGRVNMLNERDGKIIINIEDGSTGNWNVGRYTVVLRGSEREPLSLLLSSKRVRAFVSEDGTVQRVEILEMAGQAAPPPMAGGPGPAPVGAAPMMMNGKQVREYFGRVNMLNERDGKIIINIEDGSTGNWNVGRYTVVLRGSEREPLSLLLSSKRVRAFVSQDGTVQRVEILQM
jgi:phenylpyruvate tautomerase PptA (4-oxalocrotonate tautomerase family)